jgi:hypothetical protein
MTERCLRKFEGLSELYVLRYMQPVWEANAGFESDPWLSLRLFLQMYAFERQGRSPDYSFAAVDAIDENRSAPLERASIRSVWNSFRRRLRDLNYANNPLCPKGTKYSRNYRKQKRSTKVTKLSVVQFAIKLERPLVKWARDCLEHNIPSQAHGQLCSINGVGNKIASFFLRDVASTFRLAPTCDRHLLQPIDIWVRFVVHRLCKTDKLDDTECANWIVAKSSKPECMNQGIWYFCANVAQSSRYMVSRALQEPRLFDELVNRHLDELRQTASSGEAYRIPS